MRKSRLRIVFWVFTLLALLLPGAGRALAQTPKYEWINPAGGSWNDATNWSEGVVPGPGDDVEFLLPGPLSVVTIGATAFDLLVQGSSTEIIAPACELPGQGITIFGTLRIDGGGSGTPGRFRLTDADCLVSSIHDIDVFAPDAGAAGINSLALAGSTELSGDELTIDPLACLRILIDDDRSFAKPFLVIEDLGEMIGGLRLSSFGGSFPSIGTELEILGSSGGATTLMPCFGLIEAPIAVDVDFEVERDTFGPFDVRASAKIDPAATMLEVEEIQESDLYASRIVEIDVSDFDSSGGSDFVYFRSDGFVDVLLRVPGGEFVSAITFFAADDIVDGTAGDFNGDGTSDIAVLSSNGDDSGTLHLFFNAGGGDDRDWSVGPTLTISGEPVSIAPIGFDEGLVAARRGVAVTSKKGGSRGVTRAVETSDDSATETGEVEVGDDPGPSDPIDDENKKDPEAPIGVGGTEAGLVGGAKFYVLEPIDIPGDSLQLLRTIDLPGAAVDFASFDLDWDGFPETLVVTENDALVLLNPLEPEVQYGIAVSLPEGALSIAIGEFSSVDQIPYVTIGFEDGAIRIYRIENGEALGFRIFLEEELRFDLESGAIEHVEMAEDFSPRLITGFQTESSSQSASLRVDLSSVTGCSQADLDGDGQVGAGDLGLIIGAWGRCRRCAEDLNGDNVVDGEDLALIFSLWGPC